MEGPALDKQYENALEYVRNVFERYFSPSYRTVDPDVVHILQQSETAFYGFQCLIDQVRSTN